MVDDYRHDTEAIYHAYAAAGADPRKMKPPPSRAEIGRLLTEEMARPFDQDEAAEWDRQRWARRNAEAMEAMGVTVEDEPDPQQVYGPPPTSEAYHPAGAGP